MVSGGLESICHRNSSTFESNNKSETKWKTAAPNEWWHDIGCVKCKSSPCFTFWNFSFLRTKLNAWGSKPTMTWDISADPGSATWRLRAKKKQVSANKSAAVEADQLPGVLQGDQMFQQKTSNNTWSCITDNKMWKQHQSWAMWTLNLVGCEMKCAEKQDFYMSVIIMMWVLSCIET